MKVVSVSRVVTCISFLRTITSTLVAIITLYVFHILLYEIFPLGITPVTEVCDPSTLPSVSAVTTMHRSNYKIPSLPVPKEKCFTVLLLTSNRTNLLLRCLRHYASMNSIHKIIITWNNQHTEPPDFQGMIDFKVPVVIKVQTENKLRLRFNAYDDIETEGVLTVDDDFIIDEEDLKLAFEVWKQHPYGLVGFHRRSHSGQEVGNYRYQNWLELCLRGGYYSMILTGTSFVHREYLRMYTEQLPAGVAHAVDEYYNCEDIAMNFLVQDHCQCAGIFYVKNRHPLQHISTWGLSTKANHKDYRHKCINDFARFYQTMPLHWVQCRY